MGKLLRRFLLFTRLQKRAVPVLNDLVPETLQLAPREHQLDEEDNAPVDGAVEITKGPPYEVNESHGTSHFPACPIQQPPTLETLPAELRCQILSSLTELGDLRALVLASPVFYQQYLLDRKALLRRVLSATLGSLLVDAHAVQTSASLYGSYRRLDRVDPEIPRLFLDNYVALRTAAPDVILESCTEEDLMTMSAFHVSLARPLSLWCAARFLHTLDTCLEVGNLSATESIRLLRALYRFQLYCNLFGRGAEKYLTVGIGWEEQLVIFFCLFRPWEIEEIHCIYVLLKDKYEGFLDAVVWHLHRNNPQFDDWDYPPTPPGSWDLENFHIRDSLRGGIISRGLRVFYKILEADDHEELADLMQEYLVLSPEFIDVALSESTMYFRRERYALEGDRMEARSERLPFSGDTEDSPPLAWVTQWRGIYSNRYGEDLPNGLKQWGHVFWDRRRLIKSKGMEAVLRERQADSIYLY